MRYSGPVLAVAVLVASSDADAKCMMPSVHFEPASGTLPTSPVLWLFVPRYGAPPVARVSATDAAGKKHAASLAIESTSDAFTSYRVTLPKLPAGKLHVSFLDGNGGSRDADYVVDHAWKAPAIPSPKMTITRTSTWWTCSHQLTRNVVFPTVSPAYRITLGKDVVVLPANTSDMFAAYPTGGNANLALGHVNCMGSTYDWKGGRSAKVEALLPDGSATVIATSLWLDPP
jgi:hypothetical protein